MPYFYLLIDKNCKGINDDKKQQLTTGVFDKMSSDSEGLVRQFLMYTVILKLRNDEFRLLDPFLCLWLNCDENCSASDAILEFWNKKMTCLRMSNCCSNMINV